MTSRFEARDEFTCPGCGEPMSRLPAGHGLTLDDSGATICGNGVKPVEFRGEARGDP